MAMSIDPNVKAWINGAVALCGAIATLGVSVFPDYVPPGIAKDVVQTAGLIFMLYGGANTAGNLLSSNKPGALVTDPPVMVGARAVADLPKNADPGTIALTKKVAQEAVVEHQP
jgi:hypothetical protein